MGVARGASGRYFIYSYPPLLNKGQRLIYSTTGI